MDFFFLSKFGKNKKKKKIKIACWIWNLHLHLFEYTTMFKYSLLDWKYRRWNLAFTLIPIYSNVQIFFFWPEITSLGIFGQKNQNCVFKLKFGALATSNTLISMAMCICPVFNSKYSFWRNLIQKIKMVYLR